MVGTADTVGTADPQDVAKVNAKDSLNKIVEPDAPGWWDRHYGTFDAQPFEDAFAKLYVIEDGLTVAQKQREGGYSIAKADNVLNAASQQLETDKCKINIGAI